MIHREIEIEVNRNRHWGRSGGESAGEELTHSSIPSFLVPLFFVEVIKDARDI